MEKAPANPLRSIVRGAIFVFFLLVLSYAGAAFWAAISPNQAAPSALLVTIMNIGQGAWQFARPLLQLAIVLMIIDWILRRLGIQLGAGARHFDWNVQAIIAIVVVAAFAVAELSGIGSGSLKDVVLVVVGFYFGTQRRTLEVDSQSGKIREVEVHTNPVHGAAPGGDPAKEPDGHIES
jgi:hypothetical protein